MYDFNFKKAKILNLIMTLGLTIGTVWAPNNAYAEVDQTYDPTSTNAQSGVAMSEVLGDIDRLPTLLVNNTGWVIDEGQAIDPDDFGLDDMSSNNENTIMDAIIKLDYAIGDQSYYSYTNYASNASSAVLAIAYEDRQVKANADDIEDIKEVTETNAKNIENNKKAIEANTKNIETNAKAIDEIKQTTQNANANLSNRVNKLSSELDEVGALSAAMSGLHPNIEPGSKSSLAAAIGTYDGKQALAIGGFYAPTERILLSLGAGLTDAGSKMGNLGISVALDRNVGTKTTTTTYTKAQVDVLLAKLQKENDAKLAKKDALIESMLARIEALEAKL